MTKQRRLEQLHGRWFERLDRPESRWPERPLVCSTGMNTQDYAHPPRAKCPDLSRGQRIVGPHNLSGRSAPRGLRDLRRTADNFKVGSSVALRPGFAAGAPWSGVLRRRRAS